ncbi:MAG: restriction endonuclease [Chloroflexota bacterium]|nr:restriction endonuclease [Chloroflexota bacterium]
MTRSQPIVDWFFEQEFNRAWVDFDDFLVDAIQQSHDMSRYNAEEYASNNSDRLWNDLRQKIADENRRGLYPTFSEITAGVKKLFWHPQFFPAGISKHDRNKRSRIRSRSHILRTIQSLSPIQYEALSVLACKYSGASIHLLTPDGGEFGIDFFAVIPSIGKSHAFNGGTGPIRIVGQSKKHSNRVPRDRLQQFTSALNSIHQRSEDVRSLIPRWFLQQRGPIIGWFIAHNGLQSGARDFANRFGIIHSDSRDLAEIITMSRAWQPSEGVLAPVELMRREIDELLA